MTIPVTVGSIPNQSSLPLAVFSLATAPFFSDPDMGTKTFSATGLPTGITIHSTTGVISGTSSTPGTYAVTVIVTASNGAVRNIPFSLEVTGTAPGPGAAQNFYVNGTTGNDAWTGLSATFTSGTTGPWRTIPRANAVQPHASGHVDINIAPGDYRNQRYVPQFGGTNATHMIRLRAGSDGIVRMLGPTSGHVNWLLDVGVPWIHVMQDSLTRYIKIDGETVFGTGSGQLAKGDDPNEAGHVGEAIRIFSTDCIFELFITRTSGWDLVQISAGCARCIFRIDVDEHGSPWVPLPTVNPADHGDGIWVWLGTGATDIVIEGGLQGRMDHIGHNPWGLGDGTGCLRAFSSRNSWGDIPTFNNTAPEGPDGNRNGVVASQFATDVHMYGVILQNNGMPQDGASANQVETVKLEGTRNGIFDCVFRNGRMYTILGEAAQWSRHCRGGRTAHCVFEHMRGPIYHILGHWWDDPAEFGLSPFSDFCMKNVILRNVCYNPRSGWTNLLGQIYLASGQTLANTFPQGIMHGITVEDSTRDGDDFKFLVSGPTIGTINQTITWWLANEPTMFSGWTFTTDANLDNAPASTALATSITSQYVPVSDSLSVGQGVALTTVHASDTGTGTTLLLNDASWFPNPQYGNPRTGERSVSGFEIHCNGANRVYTAANYSASPPRLTVSSFARSPGMAVNLAIASGSAPNRGIRGRL